MAYVLAFIVKDGTCCGFLVCWSKLRSAHHTHEGLSWHESLAVGGLQARSELTPFRLPPVLSSVDTPGRHRLMVKIGTLQDVLEDRAAKPLGLKP